MFSLDAAWQFQHIFNQFWLQINFLLLVLLVSLGYLALKKPAQAAGLTIILLPSYLLRSKIWFLPFTYLELCILITFIGWLIKNNNIFYRPAGLLPTGLKYRWPILLILAAATISIFTGPNLTAAAGIWKAYFIEPILFFLVLTDITRQEKGKKIILWSLGVSALFISLLAIFQKFTGFGILEPDWVNPAARRVTALFTSPNAVGLFLAPIILIYLGWLWSEAAVSGQRLSVSGYQSAVIIMGTLAVIFTVSQGTWLGLIAGLVFLFYFAWNKKWTLAFVLAAMVLALIMPASRAKILPLLAFRDASGQNRLALIQISRDFLLENPKNFIFGAGLTGFAQIQNQNRDPLKMEPLLYPHNIVLNFWLETGLLGLIGFCWLIILFFKNGFKNFSEGAMSTSRLQIAIMAALVAVIVHGLIDVPYFKNDLAVLFWLIIGLL